MDKKKIVIFGLGSQFKGGIANYTTSLAKAFNRTGKCDTYIVSWTQQYPAIVPRDFFDRSSKKDLLEGTGIKIKYLTNFNNPITWDQTVKYIDHLNPHVVIFQWSIAMQGIPIGYIIRQLKKNRQIKVIFDLHFVIQKESSIIDTVLTKYGISKADSYIVHSYKTANELKKTFPNMKFSVTETGSARENGFCDVIKLYHPVYNMFAPVHNFDIESQKQKLKLKKHVFLFFGFIRKYKGLHNAIKAFAKVREKREDVSLLIVGESLWSTLNPHKFSTKFKRSLFKILNTVLRKGEDELDYQPLHLIDELELSDSVKVINQYVPNEEVYKYMMVSDCMVLYYSFATPSGVESLAYNYNLPILATRVGHFPETIKEGYNGYLAEPNNIDSMAETMFKFLEQPIPRENVKKRAEELSWGNYAETIFRYLLQKEMTI